MLVSVSCAAAGVGVGACGGPWSLLPPKVMGMSMSVLPPGATLMSEGQEL